VKQTILGGVLCVVLSNVAYAQGTNIHSRLGECGSHTVITADTQSYCYEATISGTTLAYVATLDVFHNGVRKASFLQTVLIPPPVHAFNAPIAMESWGLKPGDTITFSLKVVSGGKILAHHVTYGDVVEAIRTTTN